MSRWLIFRKKILIFVLIFLGIGIAVFKSDLIQWFGFQTYPLDVSIGAQIKTPCRQARFSSKSATQNPKKRIEQLEKLMNEPLDWLVKDIHGDIIDTYCFRDKKILLINFWASWCPPCIEELPSLSRLAKQYSDQLVVIAISTEPEDKVKSFLNRSFSDLSSHLKIAHVTQENKLQIFPEDQLPVTYIFNKKGLLKVKEPGARDWSEQNLAKGILNLP